MSKYEARLSALRLLPGRGGCFEVSLDGELIYSKLATGRHAGPGEVAGLLAKKLNSASDP